MNKPSYNEWKPLIKEKQIHKRVNELAKDISKAFGNDPFTVVCVLDGALFFGVDLMRNFLHETKDNQVRFEVVKASSYVGRSSQKIKFDKLKLTKEKIHRQNILLIDDIIETGQTLTEVRDYIESCEPGIFKIAAFLEKGVERKFPVEVDYIGFHVDDPGLWLVGYGLDDDSRYRNLKDIRIMPPE